MFDQSEGCDWSKPTPFLRFSLIAIALLFEFAQWQPFCNASDQASSLVQAALHSEIDLDADRRATLIETALKQDPNLEEAHWAHGDVRVRGQWLSLEDSAAEANWQSKLQKYRERRRSAGTSVEAQVRLAEYCRTNRLPAQERAHWNAVVALEPNHLEARRRLRHVNVGGAWIDKSEIEDQKRTELATSAFLQKHRNRLTALSIALQDRSKSRETVTKELTQFASPLVIPGLEYLFSRFGESGGLCTVETVASMSAPEASLSLARHALDFPDGSVRSRATEYLKGRDELSFVPQLLGELQSHVTKKEGFAVNQDNQVVWRQRLSFETQNAKQIATLDRVFQLPAWVRPQTVFSPQVVRRAISNSDSELDVFNAGIKVKNERVMQLLADTTNDQPSRAASKKTTPEDWWNWWNDRIESYPSDSKAVVTRYAMSYSTITPSITQPAPRYECLAAGTPIWTETGPVAVEQVKVGDLVLTQNHRSGELKFAPVLATTIRPPELLLRMRINDETVRATGGHPFWVSGKGWTKARSLQPGMGLHAARSVVVIDSIEEEQVPAQTYNLIVDEFHSYFVGKSLLLSHDNSACEPVVSRVPGLREAGILVSQNEKKDR